MTKTEQGEILFKLLGKEPKFLKVPIGIMNFAIGVLVVSIKVFPSLEDVAEFVKIGRYYAVESILILDHNFLHWVMMVVGSYLDLMMMMNVCVLFSFQLSTIIFNWLKKQ